MDVLNGKPSNMLLTKLACEDAAFLQADAVRVHLEAGDRLAGRGEDIQFVYLPEGGVSAIFDVISNGSHVNVGIVGRDGMTDCHSLLGVSQSPYDVVVQIGGAHAWRVPAERLRALCDRSSAAKDVFLHFVHTLQLQSARILASDCVDCCERRLARCLLMYHDRVHGNEILLLQKDIGLLIGVRRATITDSLHVLEGKGALRSSRGRIVIRDRARLEAIAGSAYGYPEAEFARFIAPLAKPAQAASPARPAVKSSAFLSAGEIPA